MIAILLLLLMPPSVNATTKAVMEGVAASNITVFVDTTNIRLGVGTKTPSVSLEVVGGIVLSTGQRWAGITGTPNGVADSGIIYYDKNVQAFKAISNAGTATAFPDPPGLWTCTLRNGSASSTCTTGIQSSTASCSGTEKVISGGCRLGGTGTVGDYPVIGSGPTGQGWECDLQCASAASRTTTAYANCCL